MQETLVVRREQHVPAPPAVVFALLTDPEKILRWMGTEAQVEPQPGGLYLVNVTGARVARGSFREVVPVHRLVYSFGYEGSEVVPPGSSLVEIDLVEQPDGTRRPCGRLGPLPRPASRGRGRARPGPGPLARPYRQSVTAFRFLYRRHQKRFSVRVAPWEPLLSPPESGGEGYARLRPSRCRRPGPQ